MDGCFALYSPDKIPQFVEGTHLQPGLKNLRGGGGLENGIGVPRRVDLNSLHCSALLLSGGGATGHPPGHSLASRHPVCAPTLSGKVGFIP